MSNEPAEVELPEDQDYNGDDAPTSPPDHGFFHGFWDK